MKLINLKDKLGLTTAQAQGKEAIQMYRVITGACEAGTKHFVSGLAKTKAKYKIAELIKLTKGQYGAQTFAEFFGMTAND